MLWLAMKGGPGGKAWGESPFSFDATLGPEFQHTARHLAKADYDVRNLTTSLDLSAGLISGAFLEAEFSQITETRDTVATVNGKRKPRTVNFSRTVSGSSDPSVGLRLQFLDEPRGPVSLYGKVSYKFPVADTLKLLGNGRPEVWLEGDLKKQVDKLELEANGFYSLVKNKGKSPFRNYGHTEIGGTFYPVEAVGLGLAFNHYSPEEGFDARRAGLLDTIPYNQASFSLSILPVPFLTLSAKYDQTLTPQVPSSLTLGLSLEYSWPGEKKKADISFSDQSATTSHISAEDSLPERTMLTLDAELSTPRPPRGVAVKAASTSGELLVLAPDTLKRNEFHAETPAPPNRPESYTFTVWDSTGRKRDSATAKALHILPLPKGLTCDHKPAPTVAWNPVPAAVSYDFSLSDERDSVVFATREAVKDTQIVLPVKLHTGEYAVSLTASDPEVNSSELNASFSIVDTSDDYYKRPRLKEAGVTTEHFAREEDQPERVLLSLETTVEDPLGIGQVQQVQALNPGGTAFALKQDSALAEHYQLETEGRPRCHPGSSLRPGTRTGGHRSRIPSRSDGSSRCPGWRLPRNPLRP